MKRKRCAICGRFLGRYFIARSGNTGTTLYCPKCGPKVNGGDWQRRGQAALQRIAAGGKYETSSGQV